MAIKSRKQLPSYPKASTLAAYKEKLKECHPLRDLPWEERPGCKRYEHVQIRGGRRAARFPSEDFAGGKDPGDYPPDPSSSPSGKTRGGGPDPLLRGRPRKGQEIQVDPGTRDGEPIRSSTVARRLNTVQPFDAKTQSLETRKALASVVPADVRLAAKIKEAIDRVRKTQPMGKQGFLVPRSLKELTDAGMPYRPASILIKRVKKNRFYADVEVYVPPPTKAETQILRQIGNLFLETRELLGSDTTKDVPFAQLQVLGRREMGYVDRIDLLLVKENLWSPLWSITAKQIETRHAKAVERAKRESVPWRKSSNVTFLSSFLSRQVDDELKEEKKAGRLLFWFSKAKEPLVVDLPLQEGEHSNLDEESIFGPTSRYRNLSGVSLKHLPLLLARLSLGKKAKKGGQARSNPASEARQMPDDPIFQINTAESMGITVNKAAQEEVLTRLAFDLAFPPEGVAPQLIAVQGDPKRVWWPVTKEVTRDGKKTRVPIGIKKASAGRAKAWLAIAEAARKTRAEASQAAKESYLEAGMSLRQPQRTPLMLTGTPSPEEVVISIDEDTSTQQQFPAKENPMFSDDDYWLRQYQQGPFGATSSVPTARRNAKKPRTAKQAAADQRSQAVFARAHQILAERDCDWAEAMKSAWAEAKGNPRAGSSFRYGKVKGPPRKRRAAKPARTEKQRLSRHKAAGVLSRAHEIFNERPECDLAEALQLAWAEIGGKAKNNPFSEFSARHPVFSQELGQFSTSQARTHGLQPVNRRNPGLDPNEIKVNKFNPNLKCCVCGNLVPKGSEMIVNPDVTGPRGGKKYCHVPCHPHYE